MKVDRSLKAICALVVLAVMFPGLNSSAEGQSKGSRGGSISGGSVAINGLVFTMPKGYARLPSGSPNNAVFFYNRKTREGLVVAVPPSPFAEPETLQGLIKESQQRFFPKESAAYKWKSVNLLQKVSKFEVNDSLEKGFNRNHLWVFEYRHVVFNQRDVVIGTIFEARRGKAAAEMFDSEGAAMSMTSCSAAAEVIYSFTGEKIDPEKPPCELIANVPE